MPARTPSSDGSFPSAMPGLGLAPARSGRGAPSARSAGPRSQRPAGSRDVGNEL